MSRPITSQIMTELTAAAQITGHCAGLLYFEYEDVVEALRQSEFAYRFDFEKYDLERSKGNKQTDLYFNFVDKIPGTFYEYPTYQKCNLYLRRFTLSYRKNRALPRIESTRYYCRYMTIEQLMAMLAIVVPKIDELETGILDDYEKDLRLTRIQELYSSTVPDLVKTTFDGTGIGYWYIMGKDSIELKTRLPKEMLATFTLKFKNLSDELQDAIAITKEITATMERYGRIKIEKYSGSSIQWSEG